MQQVRQDQETQGLQQKLKHRTSLGLLMFLLAAGALLYLLLRGPVVSEDMQLAMQAGSASDEKAAAAIANIENDMLTLRTELAELRDSVTRVARAVEEVDAVAAPELPAQVMRLNETVAVLERQDLQQQQETAELRREQAQQQQDDTELRTSQEQLQVELERIAGEVESLAEKASTPPANATAPLAGIARPGAGKAWTQARESGRYTLQLAGFHRPESLGMFKKMHALGGDTAVYETEYQGRKWHVVFHGIYDTVGQALAAAAQLSPELAARQPWVRRIPPTGEILPF